MEQVDATVKDMINAVILRAVQDVKLEALYVSNPKGASLKLKADAIHFIKSEDFEFMCESVGKNYTVIRRNLAI